MILRTENGTEVNKWNSIFTCCKEVWNHNCRLNGSLRMDFGWLMDTHKITLFSKKQNKIKQSKS